MNKVKIGIIGCGTISTIYLKNFTSIFDDILEVVACADINIEVAREQAAKFKIPNFCSVEQILANPEIEIIVNLTIPKAHHDVCMSILNAGKNVYVEKPLSITLKNGIELINKAKEMGLLIGGAPDTFLGAGIQTCKRLIDSGAIGQPIAATSFRVGHGPEDWHPNPEFYYKSGAGPLFDVGPYDLTALVTLIGPVANVKSSAKTTFPTRTITSKPKFGQTIDVEVPTHVTSILDFENGATGIFITSFDIWGAQLPFIEIYGTEGSLKVPDANTFGGPVYIFKKGASQWEEVPVTQNYSQDSRGLGVADMAYSLRTGRKHRANSDLTFHVLDIMQSIIESYENNASCSISSSCDCPKTFDGINFE